MCLQAFPQTPVTMHIQKVKVQVFWLVIAHTDSFYLISLNIYLVLVLPSKVVNFHVHLM